MKLEKAIENLERASRLFDQHLSENYLAAIKLGIEALKRVQDMRSPEVNYSGGLLPSETTE